MYFDVEHAVGENPLSDFLKLFMARFTAAVRKPKKDGILFFGVFLGE